MNERASGSRLARNAMAYVLAGGRGTRLMELTDRRAKPAVYFGGKSRIIDFALSNALNSGIRRIGVATQYKAHSLIRHLQRGWNFFRPERNESFDILPASQRVSETQWYVGTADAVYQNIDIIEAYGPEYIVILAGDHIYKMDYELMLRSTSTQGADVTVGCLEVPRMEATGFGVMHVDENGPDHRLPREAQRPAAACPASRTWRSPAWASTSSTELPVRPAPARRRRPELQPRFRQGHHPLHRQARQGGGASLRPSCVRSSAEPDAYWRDVGTVDAYWEANIDLTDVVPELDLFDRDWPIWTYAEITPPAKFVHDEDGRRGQAVQLAGLGRLHHLRRLAAALAAVHRRARQLLRHVEDAVIMPYVDVARGARLKNVVIDRGVGFRRGWSSARIPGSTPSASAAPSRASA